MPADPAREPSPADPNPAEPGPADPSPGDDPSAGGAAGRSYDLVLLGASGFTGGLTAEYLAARAPAGCRWALAGRNQDKLAELRRRLAAINPECADLPLLHADVEEPDSLRAVAESSRVVLTTIGPYLSYGEPLVAACAEAGTDYLDLTGEPEFVDRMYLAHHARAAATGARLVHACGFDSIPHDLGAYFTAAQLRPDQPIRVRGFLRARGNLSGGTLASALASLPRARQLAATARRRRAVEPRPNGRSARAVAGRPGYDRVARAWVLPLPTIDPLVVARSARALQHYGPQFTYSHYAAVQRLPVAAAGVAGALGFLAAAQIPPLRRALGRLRAPGHGPSASARAKGWFTVRFHGEAGEAHGAPASRPSEPSGTSQPSSPSEPSEVVTEVSGPDPGYTATSIMLAEAGLCLAFDELPATAGQVTPAVAMGDALITRLHGAGIEFRVLDASPSGPPARRVATTSWVA